MADNDSTTPSAAMPEAGLQRLTPVDVQQKQFRLAFRGYHEREVDEFLDDVTEELARLHAENRRLREELGGDREGVAGARTGRVSAEAEDGARRLLDEARARAAAIVADAESRAAALLHEARMSGSGGAAPGPERTGTDERLTRVLAREKEFLQRLAGLIQGHAEAVKQEVRTVKESGTPEPSPPGPAMVATPEPAAPPEPATSAAAAVAAESAASPAADMAEASGLDEGSIEREPAPASEAAATWESTPEPAPPPEPEPVWESSRRADADATPAPAWQSTAEPEPPLAAPTDTDAESRAEPSAASEMAPPLEPVADTGDEWPTPGERRPWPVVAEAPAEAEVVPEPVSADGPGGAEVVPEPVSAEGPDGGERDEPIAPNAPWASSEVAMGPLPEGGEGADATDQAPTSVEDERGERFGPVDWATELAEPYEEPEESAGSRRDEAEDPRPSFEQPTLTGDESADSGGGVTDVDRPDDREGGERFGDEHEHDSRQDPTRSDASGGGEAHQGPKRSDADEEQSIRELFWGEEG
ncbi:MAG: DivIVA domain-containing protein [Actinomycetota bacterium]